MEQMLQSISDVRNYLKGKKQWYILAETQTGKDYSTVINELDHMLTMCEKGIKLNEWGVFNVTR